MAHCEHVALLRLSPEQENPVYDEDRFTRVNAELLNPEQQWPSMLLFVGHKAMDNALRQLFL